MLILVANQKKVFFVCLLFFILLFCIHVFADTCGNGSCEASENSCTCQADCGSCSGDVPDKLCKQFACQENICSIKVVPNCCGNQLCEATEDYGNCSSDCTPKNIGIEVLSPTDLTVLRGEKVLLKVRITADGRAISSPTVKATSVFGTLSFFNDGKHDDDLAADNVFATSFNIPNDASAGEKPFDVNAVFLGVKGKKIISLNLDPRLGVTFNASDIELGKNLEMSGIVLKKHQPAEVDFELKLFIANNEVFSQNGRTDLNGVFSASYRSSLLDSVGEWKIVVNAKDEFSNAGTIEKHVVAIRPQIINPLNIEFEKDVEKKYFQGDNIDFVVRLVNDRQELVRGAKVFIKREGLQPLELLETSAGKYARSVLVSREFKTGFNEFEVQAVVDSNELQLRDSQKVVVEVASSGLKIEVIEPSNLSYAVGETMDLVAKVTDFEGNPVSDATVKALVNGKEVVLSVVKLGTYSAKHELVSLDQGNAKVEFSATDGFGNEGLKVFEVTVGGKSFFYDIFQNVLIFGGVAILALVVGTIVLSFFKSKKGLKDAKKKILAIEASEQDIQKKYFHEHAISKQEYLDLMEKYENEKKKLQDSL